MPNEMGHRSPGISAHGSGLFPISVYPNLWPSRMRMDQWDFHLLPSTKLRSLPSLCLQHNLRFSYKSACLDCPRKILPHHIRFPSGDPVLEIFLLTILLTKPAH